MNIELHLILNGVDRGPLPSYQSLSISPIFCDIGALSFKYPVSGKRYSLIEGLDEIEVVPWIDGVPHDKLGGYVNQISGDDVNDTSVIDFSGQMYLRRMEEIRAFPKGWPNYDPADPSHQFADKTAGHILEVLLAAAQARGTATDIVWSSFSAAHDSNGQPWTKAITLEVKPDATIMGVLDSLYGNNMVEFEMAGKELRVYNYGTLFVDRTIGPGKPLTFRKGRDLTDSPRKISSRDVATVMLGAGKEDTGLYHMEVDDTAVAQRRRIEGYVGNGNIIEAGTLDAFTEAHLARSVNPKMEKTHGLALSSKKTPKPLGDFNIGDWAYSDTGKGLERLRVKQWVISVEANGLVKGSVTLNDLIAEQNANLTRRIDGIIGGSTLTGESKAVDNLPAEVTDGNPPAGVPGLALASAPFMGSNGQVFAQVTATWAQVTQNADGTLLNDLGGYSLQWAYSANPGGWNQIDQADTGTIMQFSPVAPGVEIYGRIRAFDKWGNAGPWSAVVQHTTQDDLTAPEKPSTPTADNYMGLLRITFDGKTLSNAAWASDVEFFKVHASTIPGFTPDNSTWVDTLTSAGSSYLDPGYDQTRYVKIQAVDRSGNHSVPSNQAVATTSRLLSDDIFAGAVGTAQLADFTVTTIKIQNGAVNDLKVSSLSAAKITAGVINAEITVSGRIATALSGKRSEMNGIGFQSWNASGEMTVSLDGANNLLQGIFRTALTGRRIEIGASGNLGEIRFIGPDGRLGRISGFTAQLGEIGDETLSFGIPITNTFTGAWNGFQVNLDEEAYLYSGFTVIGAGGNGGGTKGFQVRYLQDRGNATTAPAGWIRISVNDTNTDLNGPDGGTRIRAWSGGSAVYPGDGSRLETIDAGHANAGPRLNFISGGAGYRGIFKYIYLADSYGHRFEVRDVGDTNFINHLAATHYNLSDERAKENIRDIGRPALKLMKKARGKVYSYKHEAGEGRDAPMRFGIMAQDLPKELTQPTEDGTLMVSPMAVASMAINMIHELEEELAELRELVSK